jgi:hypothetical protein
MNRVTVLSLTTAALLVVGGSTGLVQRSGLQTISAALSATLGQTDGQTDGQTQQIEPLSANDISWLFPAPANDMDLAKLISMRDLTAGDGPVWSEDIFHQFLTIAAGPAGSVEGTTHRIGLPAEVWSRDVWYISGVRIDPGAPGLSPDLVKQFGRSPQIRLSVQPIARTADGKLKVYDIAAHLAFSFTMAKANGDPDDDVPFQIGCFPRPKANAQAFKAIVADLVALRDTLKNGQPSVTTTSPLGIHPGLNNTNTAINTRNEMKALLERHLSSNRLTAMTITALSAGLSSSWIFLPIFDVPPNTDPSRPKGGFVPLHSPALDGHHYAQLFNAAANQHKVVPAPYTNNLIGPTCRHAGLPIAGPPIDDRIGVATAPLMNTLAKSEDDRNDILQKINTLIDPDASHLFNTDCVSCHTETRLGITLLNGDAHIKEDIDKRLLPNHPWNVRGFGWFPHPRETAQPTVSHRVGKETFAVLTFINERCLPRPEATCMPDQ